MVAIEYESRICSQLVQLLQVVDAIEYETFQGENFLGSSEQTLRAMMPNPEKRYGTYVVFRFHRAVRLFEGSSMFNWSDSRVAGMHVCLWRLHSLVMHGSQ